MASIKEQDTKLYDLEIVIVDSGSEDNTLEIAQNYNCKIVHIKKQDFTFGRSLNYGCDAASGDFLVFISGHCIPVNSQWINKLIAPLENDCSYTYGKQIARDTTKFSERQLFDKYYPAISSIPQIGFFCNNANSAIKKEIWNKFKFNEDLTGCEDMFLAKELVKNNYHIGYVSEAPVYHIHDESWSQIRIRYEREAVALRVIMPEVTISLFDVIRYICVGIFKDIAESIRQKVFSKEFYSIIRFRISQYIGSFMGNKKSLQDINKMKDRYFYPRVTNMEINQHEQ